MIDYWSECHILIIDQKLPRNTNPRRRRKNRDSERRAKGRKVKAPAYYRARQWLILDWADRGYGENGRGKEGRVTARNRRQDCHPVVRLGDRRERSSVKPLIMPKQYTVGAPVSVPDPHCSGLVPSKFGASNEFQWNSCHPTVLSNRLDTWKLFRKRSRWWNV